MNILNNFNLYMTSKLGWLRSACVSNINDKLVCKRWFHHLLPVSVFLLFALFYYGYSEYHNRHSSDGDSFGFVNTWLRGRFDQGIYRGIGVVGYSSAKRSGWYPGASIVGGLSWRLAGRPKERGIGAVIFYLGFYIPSFLCGIAFFYCFYRYAYLKWGVRAGVLSLASLVCFPPSFYFLTAFPYNMSLACMTAYLLVYMGASRYRQLWLWVIAFLCSITYPTAALFVIFPLVDEFVKQLRGKRFRFFPYVFYGLPFVLGPLAFFTHLYFVTGDFWGYVHHQGHHYNRVFGQPLAVVLDSFRENTIMFPENIVAIAIGFYIALFANKAIGFSLWLYVLTLLVFSPMTGSFQCVYRHYLLAFPLHYLFATSEKHISVKLVVLAICCWLCVKHFFLMYLTMQLV